MVNVHHCFMMNFHFSLGIGDVFLNGLYAIRSLNSSVTARSVLAPLGPRAGRRDLHPVGEEPSTFTLVEVDLGAFSRLARTWCLEVTKGGATAFLNDHIVLQKMIGVLRCSSKSVKMS